MRLTEKRENGYYDKEECVISECSSKLGQLEDIEEELGIDLITLFKALGNKIVIKNDKYHYVDFEDVEQDTNGDYLFNLVDGSYYFKDYGKTWALTKEELEND